MAKKIKKPNKNTPATLRIYVAWIPLVGNKISKVGVTRDSVAKRFAPENRGKPTGLRLTEFWAKKLPYGVALKVEKIALKKYSLDRKEDFEYLKVSPELLQAGVQSIILQECPAAFKDKYPRQVYDICKEAGICIKCKRQPAMPIKKDAENDEHHAKCEYCKKESAETDKKRAQRKKAS